MAKCGFGQLINVARAARWLSPSMAGLSSQ